VLGGGPAKRNVFTHPVGGRMVEPAMVSKLGSAKLKKGERVRLETPGGGGYGPAAERSPAAIAEDIRLGYVTNAATRKAAE